MMFSLLNSQLLSALVGGLLTGLLTFVATWWTLKRGFKNQIQIIKDDQHEKQRGAGWALIAEMSENLARLQALSNLANEHAPVANMRRNLNLNRYIFDGQLPSISLRLGLENLRMVTAAYASVSNLFAILEGKWNWAADTSSPTESDVKSLAYAADNYDRALRTLGRAILSPEELQVAGLG